MNNYLNINFIRILDHSLVSNGTSAEFFNEVSIPYQSFNNYLYEQLNNLKVNPGEEKHKVYDPDKNNNEKAFSEKQELMNSSKNNSITNDKNDIIDNKNIQSSKNEQNIDNNGSIIRKDENDSVRQKDKIQKEGHENAIKNKNTTIKEKEPYSDETSVFLKDISLILEMIKGLPLDKKQLNEIRSTLAELKSSLENKNSFLNKNNAVLANGSELKKVLEQLKTLLEAANERIGLKSNIKKVNNKIEVKTDDKQESKFESLNIINLKKQISKLTEEIKQYLNNKKPENIAGKSDESSSENKNAGNQKVINEPLNSDRGEGSRPKDNASNYNFSFLRKETDSAGSVLQRDNPAGSPKSNAFNEHLNTIIQNAKIVVRDSKNGSFSMKLYPESLGRVNVNLNLEHGVILGKFLVDSAAAKEILLENMYSVMERLQENGISVGEFQVNVRDESSAYSGFSSEGTSYNTTGKHNISAGIEYESNSLYLHDGEIDLII